MQSFVPRRGNASAAAALVQRGMLRLPPSPSSPPRPSPSLLFLPGLTARPWWDAADARFAPWLAPLCAAAASGVLAAEQDALAAAARGGSDYKLQANEHALHAGAWSWQALQSRGADAPAAVAAAAPVTAAALAAMPCRMTGVPFAYAFFSRMGPGCEIAPHFGPTNLRVRVHVPVRVPAGGAAVAGLRVGGETRGYDLGRALVFDDAFEHSAWNKSPTAERDVLLFDLWHPELSPGDIASVQRLFGEAREQGWIK